MGPTLSAVGIESPLRGEGRLGRLLGHADLLHRGLRGLRGLLPIDALLRGLCVGGASSLRRGHACIKHARAPHIGRPLE